MNIRHSIGYFVQPKVFHPEARYQVRPRHFFFMAAGLEGRYFAIIWLHLSPVENLYPRHTATVTPTLPLITSFSFYLLIYIFFCILALLVHVLARATLSEKRDLMFCLAGHCLQIKWHRSPKDTVWKRWEAKLAHIGQGFHIFFLFLFLTFLLMNQSISYLLIYLFLYFSLFISLYYRKYMNQSVRTCILYSSI